MHYHRKSSYFHAAHATICCSCCREFVSLFLCGFENGSSCDHIGRFYSHEYVVAIVEKLYHAFARVTWVELADEDMLNAFLD